MAGSSLRCDVSVAGSNDSLLRRGVTMTINWDGISHFPVKQTTAHEFASLSLARAYIDTVQEKASSFRAQPLIEALEHLDRAYQKFPELELDRPRGDLSEGLRLAVKSLPDHLIIPLLINLVAFDPTSLASMTFLFEKIVESDNWRWLLLMLRSLDPSIRFNWRLFKPVVSILPQRGRDDMNLSFFAELLKRIDFSEEERSADFGNVLAHLLSDERPAGIDSGALAKAVQSARRPPSRPAPSVNKRGSRAGLLAIAQRLRAAPSLQRPNPHPDLFWPSGRMSFDEFFMQWPCKVELPADLDDQALIEEAYQAILLRRPGVAEMSQYLRLLQDGIVSKHWIIEDLLGSKEFRSFERRLCVIWGGAVITEPGRSDAAEIPAVNWPWRSAT